MKLNFSRNQLLKQLRKKTYPEIAKENNVGMTTVYRRAKQFRLVKPRVPWTLKELSKLETNYVFNQDVHTLFPKRTLSSVYHKANRLNLKREMYQRDYSVNWRC